MTHDEAVSAAAPSGIGPENMPVVDPGALPEVAGGVICQAEAVEIGIDGASTDPFDATFLLAGTDPQGREAAVWIRLTPATINDLTEQLAQVLVAQKLIMGISSDDRTSSSAGGDDEPEDEEDPSTGEGRVKRFFDPMGIRHLKDRSPRSTVVLGAAIATLVILAFVLHLVRG